mgnify:FL=1
MKTLLTLYVLLLSSLVVADDISDFDIEGISIGDSLLEHFTLIEIQNNFREYDYKKIGNLDFVTTEFAYHKKFKTFDAVQFYTKENDKNYKIYSISGGIFYTKNDINLCYEKLETQSNEFDLLFPDTKKGNPGERVHYADPTEKSLYTGLYYVFESGGFISTECYKWSNYMKEKYGSSNNFKISVTTEIFRSFINQQ